jgi:hypothetical protein
MAGEVVTTASGLAGKTPAQPAGSGITKVLTPSQITNLAQSEAQTSISGQTAPYQADIATAGSQQQRTLSGIQSMFGSILPYTQGSAEQVTQGYNEALGASSSIMNAAQTRLNQLKQSRAQEAQAMAQEIGGPVALGEFTAGLDDQGTLLANLSAGQLLHTLGYAQAGEQQAQAFAGQVLPLVQTENEATARGHFQDVIAQAQKQIDAIKATKGDLVNQKVNDLTTQERTYALQKAQENLAAIKQKQDHLATVHTLANDDARLKLSQGQFAAQKAAQAATTKLNQQRLTDQEKQFQQQLGLTKQQMIDRKAELAATAKVSSQRVSAAERNTWAQWLDQGVNPQPGKPITTTTVVPSDYQQALKDPKNSYKGTDPKTHQPQWYHIIKTTDVPPTNAAITGPNNLVDYLVAHNVPKNTAVNMVRANMHIPNWKYGQPNPNAPKPPKPTKSTTITNPKVAIGPGQVINTPPYR